MFSLIFQPLLFLTQGRETPKKRNKNNGSPLCRTFKTIGTEGKQAQKNKGYLEGKELGP